MKRAHLHLGLTIAAVALAAALAGAWLATVYRGNSAGAVLLPDKAMTAFPEPKPLAVFSLVDHDDRPFDLARLRGRWSFVFFGFTHCPDVCPTSLATLARLRESLGDATAQVIFISVDPQRDRGDKLKSYATFFHPDFVGVTGADAEIRKLAGQLGAAYEVSASERAQDYSVVHSAAVFLIDPQARYRAVFTPPLDARAIGSRFRALREMAAREAT